MDYSKFKTEDFLNAYENWGKRAIKLRTVAENAADPKRKEKAFKLFAEMYGRLLLLRTYEIRKFSQPKINN